MKDFARFKFEESKFLSQCPEAYWGKSECQLYLPNISLLALAYSASPAAKSSPAIICSREAFLEIVPFALVS